MEELKALTEKIAADGHKPWCIGLGSGGATGWPATDWVEDMMLRTQKPEVYDKWVTNENQVSTTLPSSAPSMNSAGSPATTPMSTAEPRRWLPPTSATAPRACSPRRPSATCTARRRSFRPSSRKARSSARMRTSSTCRLTRRSLTSAIRCSAPARWSRSPRIRLSPAPSSPGCRRRSLMKSGWPNPAS